MRFRAIALPVLIGLVGLLPGKAEAAILTFEGLGDDQAIVDYYNGGGGGVLGISFVNALASIEFTAGGFGSFANEPSPVTIAYIPFGSTEMDMNVAGGFGANGVTTFFSFWYTTTGAANSRVRVFSGVNGMGTELYSTPLAGNGLAADGCNAPGSDVGIYGCWTQHHVTFAGTALSVRLEADAGNFLGIDDVAFEVAAAPPAIPEPGTLALVGLGLALVGLRARKRRS